jgi:hypothetical protein
MAMVEPPMLRGMERIRESPWTLWVAAIGFLVALFVPMLFAETTAPARTVIGAVVVVGVVLLYVVRGSRLAWVVAVVVMTGGAIGVAVNGTWWEALLRLSLLGLLLVPASRAFVWQHHV